MTFLPLNEHFMNNNCFPQLFYLWTDLDCTAVFKSIFQSTAVPRSSLTGLFFFFAAPVVFVLLNTLGRLFKQSLT